MKLVLMALIGGLLVMTSCMKPMDADFSTRKGLNDDEMLWVMQIPAMADQADLNLSVEDSTMITSYNSILFDQIVPMLFKDMMAGDINAYENYGTFADDLTQARLNEKLKKLELSKSDFSPLQFKAELFSIVQTNSNSYRHEPKFLRLIAVDTSSGQSVQPFAGAFVDDMVRKNYAIKGARFEKISLLDFLNQEQFFYLPSYIRSNFREYLIESGEEAKFVKDLVVDGAWTSIEWVEGQINVSGKKKIQVEDLSGLPYTGSYQINQGDSSEAETDAPELYLTAEKDYLVADWSNRSNVERIFPYEKNAFFSAQGELYRFENSVDSLLTLNFTGKGDSIQMTGKSDWVNVF